MDRKDQRRNQGNALIEQSPSQQVERCGGNATRHNREDPAGGLEANSEKGGGYGDQEGRERVKWAGQSRAELSLRKQPRRTFPPPAVAQRP